MSCIAQTVSSIGVSGAERKLAQVEPGVAEPAVVHRGLAECSGCKRGAVKAPRSTYSTASQRVPGQMSGYNRAGRSALAIRLTRRLTSHHSISDHRMPRKKQALTVEDLWSLKRVGTPTISPDGRAACAPVTIYNMEKNEG